jgi:hypothetical protein
MESNPNTLCPKCLNAFDSRLVKIKRKDPYEGFEVLVFDCPCCGKEIHNMECYGLEKGEYE